MTVNQCKVKVDDENYTYPSLVKPILPFIEEYKKANNKDNIVIWCPFDLAEPMLYNDIVLFKSNYVDIFTKAGYKVVNSHIAKDQDFFTYEPKEWDIMISNPPFKNKKVFFERALSFNKPFALVSPASWLNDSGIMDIYKDVDMQLLIPDKRARFFKDTGSSGSQPSFKSIYYCYNFLQGKDIQWFELDISKDKRFLKRVLRNVKRTTSSNK